MVRPNKSPNRAQRVTDQIQRDLAELIAREVRDPRVGMVTISGVELTPDYAHAKVYFTVIGSEPQETAAGLNAAAGHLHKLLFKRLSIHTVPRLVFVRDQSLERGFAIDGLIRQALAGPMPAVANDDGSGARSGDGGGERGDERGGERGGERGNERSSGPSRVTDKEAIDEAEAADAARSGRRD